jgi:DNA helicase-2/ATP-dependent DNA helicase PcrA
LGDLLLETLHILKTQPEILADYRDRFRYMLVDEYQDTTVVQYLWLNLLARGSGNVCVVGDDDQSIYGWRGAEVETSCALSAIFPAPRYPAGTQLSRHPPFWARPQA